MRIGLVSDTHIPQHVKELPIAELTEVFKGVDLILHGGDIYALSVLNDLERIAPVLASRGDDDYGETARDARVQEKHVLKLGGQIIWLVHQRPYIPRMPPAWWESRINPEQGDFGKPNIVVFGHEHRTVLETVDGVIFVSPGSPTFLHYTQGLGTYGIIDTDSGTPDVRVLHL
ncbi:MAG: metallophosphoesterase family protein [Chloroflexi bacterium]|nr:metallophosphoesterase family protein [Chloroflexota bacterium]